MLSCASILGSSNLLATEKVTYYYTDQQGTPLGTTDSAGNVTSVLDARPFGQAVLSANDGPGFQGQYADDSSFVYMKARYYDPSIGRFISADPIASEFNQYSFASNNPLTHQDPTGLYDCASDSKDCDKKLDPALGTIKSAASQLQTSDPRRHALVNVVSAYGTKGDGNGVIISFASGETPGNTTYSDNGASVNFDMAKMDNVTGPNGPHYSNVVDFAAAVAHEGQHLVDGPHLFDLTAKEGVKLHEEHAFRTQGFVNQILRSESAWHLWKPGFTQQDMVDAYQWQGAHAADYICKLRTCK
nr:RHS repeat-associated core domain-containing protein [Pinirhizobacter soli]